MHTGPVLDVCWSDDGSKVFTASCDKTAKMWDLNSNQANQIAQHDATVVTKSNAQRHAMVMWDEIAVQIATEFPDVTWDKELVDACTARMVNRPASLASGHLPQ